MKLAYPAVFYKNEETGAFAVEVPDLPGCATGGNTLADAIFMAIDAASGWVLDELEDGKPVPAASALDMVQPGQRGFVSLLALDMDEYAKKFGGKAITYIKNKVNTLENDALTTDLADARTSADVSDAQGEMLIPLPTAKPMF
jgi:predicted RNase H-like HicB family nuclease